MTKEEIIKKLRDMAKYPTVTLPRDTEALRNAADLLEQAQQAEPVAMKFKIYKPTVPDPMRQDINDALLPWVYDQSRGSGFVASMWVTPVATLPPPRQPLLDEEISNLWDGHTVPVFGKTGINPIVFARAIEAAHGIKEKKHD